MFKKFTIFAIALVLTLTSFVATDASPNRGDRNRAVSRQRADDIRRAQVRNDFRRREVARQIAIERAIRARQLRDFNRRSLFVDPFFSPFGFRSTFNPFLSRELFLSFGNRNRFSIGVGF